jgi:hypothetical protein
LIFTPTITAIIKSLKSHKPLLIFFIFGGALIGINNLMGPQQPLKIVDGLHRGPIDKAFEHYLSIFSDQTSIAIQRVKVEDYSATIDAEALIPDVDLILNSEFVSANLGFRIDQGIPINYIPISELIPEVHNIHWMASLSIHYGSRDGQKLYAIPFNPSMGIIYINKTVLKKAGVKLDSQRLTWNDVYNLGYKLKEKGFTGFTFPWTAAYTLEYLG